MSSSGRLWPTHGCVSVGGDAVGMDAVRHLAVQDVLSTPSQTRTERANRAGGLGQTDAEAREREAGSWAARQENSEGSSRAFRAPSLSPPHPACL